MKGLAELTAKLQSLERDAQELAVLKTGCETAKTLRGMLIRTEWD